jgi:hypothetical protein
LHPQTPPAWRENPIDRFVFAKLAEKGLRHSPPADKRTLLRRAKFDLLGLPPTPEELDLFLKDESPDAYRRLIDRLLASPHYGERWGRHWLDVVRFGESHGYERNHLRDNAWQYRDYVVKSFNDDKPYGRFVMEQLAGDQLSPGDPAVEVGTGFLVAGSYDDVGNQDAKAQAIIRANTLDDVISATGSAFLGLTINCTRCHDHKFDPIPQKDYYRLRAAFEGVQQAERTLAAPQMRKQWEAKRRSLEKDLSDVDAKLADLKKAKADSNKAPPKELEAQRASLHQKLAALGSLPTAWIGVFQQPGDPTFLAKGGDPQKRDGVVPAARLEVLQKLVPAYTLAADSPEGARRLALARSIVHPSNALALRVAVNRIWHYHFGRGLAATPGDFGWNGVRPTHPELLDWLAAEFAREGGRWKPLHRRILLSQTYQQRSDYRSECAAVDADDHYLWRFPPQRLTAEAVRDTLLAVAGKLDLRIGGPGFRLYDYSVDNVAAYVPRDHVGPETYRRAIYHQSPRSAKVDLLAEYDLPECSLPAPKRETTTSPLQALALLNHSFIGDVSRRFASRLEREAGADSVRQVKRAFALAFNREPSAEESTNGAALIRKHGLAVFCRAVLNANEVVYVY